MDHVGVGVYDSLRKFHKEVRMVLRLFTAAALLCAAQAFAQVQPDNSSNAAPAADQFLTGPYLQLNLGPPNSAPDNPIQALSQPKTGLAGVLDTKKTSSPNAVEIPWQTDATCFRIQSYLMVRDDPHSDSTHFKGYTTCVPSARFRVYTTDERR